MLHTSDKPFAQAPCKIGKTGAGGKSRLAKSGKPAIDGVWPKGQVARKWAKTDVMVTDFADHADYSVTLLETVLSRGADRKLSHHFDDATGFNAVKVYDIETWNTPEARLINARALAFFRKFVNTSGYLDASWASIYVRGNFVLPHSHIGNAASVLYMLEPGETLATNDGQFMFADPRMEPCCRQQKGFMSTPSAPRSWLAPWCCSPRWRCTW